MCGRFSLFAKREDLKDLFQVYNWEEFEWIESYNIAPSQNVLAVVKADEGNRAGMLRWGLIPSWASDPKIGYKMINARSETVDERRSYKNLLSRRRCLIIADGFYEWKNEGKTKQPYRFQLKSQKPFAFAGLWDRWEQNNETIHSCTIITTEANEIVKDVHDRMPVILTDEAEQVWLDRQIDDDQYLKSLLVPYSANEMELYPISTLVNSPKNNLKEIVNSL